ncbi:type II toxin-antitoxin system PemK/MazF family toxin [Candidatus Peregrinibacteria bacterium]|nr:MAG: type II toxin-antitoxin system PemK/MazF family toxin [Candidatus Peregrinibacteria bacterium]
MKRFLEWIGLKRKLDLRRPKIPYVNTGEVWWASLGENIGYEINGKSDLFTRPVLIFKKLSKEFYLAIPLTTKKHVGSWYVNYQQRGRNVTACLHQVRTIDYRRLYSKVGIVDESDFKIIRLGFQKLYL